MQVRLLLDAVRNVRPARSSIGSGRQPLTLARRVRFPHGSCRVESGESRDKSQQKARTSCLALRSCLSTNSGQVVQLADTRRSERRARRGLGVQISPWSIQRRERNVERQEAKDGADLSSGSCHSTFQRRRWTRVQRGLISPASRVQLPNLPLRSDRFASVSHDRVRKPAKRSGREPGACGFDSHLGQSAGEKSERTRDKVVCLLNSDFSPLLRKVAGYGWPGRTANAVLSH